MPGRTTDQANERIIDVTLSKQIVWQYGMTGDIGSGHDQLNAPYDAKVIGDYTGLTPPFGFGDD